LGEDGDVISGLVDQTSREGERPQSRRQYTHPVEDFLPT
jgi:hypothetical protein